LNQIFLFYSDDTNGSSDLLNNDLSDFSNSDLKYAVHVNQWNPKIETSKIERKTVIENLLKDLFGGGAEALANIDVFSNEGEVDEDISKIFHTRLSNQQRVNLSAVQETHGSFSSLKPLNHEDSRNLFVNSVLISGEAISATLLEQAAIASCTVNANDTQKVAFRRQFDTTNTSNGLYSLPTGWRTFQFVDGDSLSFHLKVKQYPTFIPDWGVNKGGIQPPTSGELDDVGHRITGYTITLKVKNS
jgi:hypothetical protein